MITLVLLVAIVCLMSPLGAMNEAAGLRRPPPEANQIFSRGRRHPEFEDGRATRSRAATPGARVLVAINSAEEGHPFGKTTALRMASGPKRAKIRHRRELQTRNGGIFLRRDAATEALTRVALSTRPSQDYSPPVYWLGRIANSESLFLSARLLAREDRAKLPTARDGHRPPHDSRFGQILEGIVRESKVEGVRKSAASGSGKRRRYGFLASSSPMTGGPAVRKQAAFAIGVIKDRRRSRPCRASTPVHRESRADYLRQLRQPSSDNAVTSSSTSRPDEDR